MTDTPGPQAIQPPLDEETLHRVKFAGSWVGFLGLALVNLLLTVLTLGLFRFWARTRERRFLWRETEVGGEPLDYTGRGIELFLGALLVFLVILLPLSALSFAATSADARGELVLAVGLNLLFAAALLLLFGYAVWRAMRYRLSRTRWSGIRGAMAGNGRSYALLHAGMTLFQAVTLGFATPYANTRLFNARWSDARLGSMPFEARADWRPLMRLFLLNWTAALLVLAAAGSAVILSWPGSLDVPTEFVTLPPDVAARFALTSVVAVLGSLLAISLLLLRYHAAEWRTHVAGLRLDGLHFRFTASAGDWLRYWAVNLAIVVFTFGLGLLLLPWRYWAFRTRHLEADGALGVDWLRQTRLEAPTMGEGLADAFDIGGV